MTSNPTSQRQFFILPSGTCSFLAFPFSYHPVSVATLLVFPTIYILWHFTAGEKNWLIFVGMSNGWMFFFKSSNDRECFKQSWLGAESNIPSPHFGCSCLSLNRSHNTMWLQGYVSSFPHISTSSAWAVLFPSNCLLLHHWQCIQGNEYINISNGLVLESQPHLKELPHQETVLWPAAILNQGAELHNSVGFNPFLWSLQQIPCAIMVLEISFRVFPYRPPYPHPLPFSNSNLAASTCSQPL